MNKHYEAADSILEENRHLIVGDNPDLTPDLIEVLAFAQAEATLALVDIMVDLSTIQASKPVRGTVSLTEQAQRILRATKAATDSGKTE